MQNIVKKEFQKVIALIRAERNTEQQRNCEAAETPVLSEYGRKFVEFVLKWAYPQDYLELVGGAGGCEQ